MNLLICFAKHFSITFFHCQPLPDANITQITPDFIFRGYNRFWYVLNHLIYKDNKNGHIAVTILFVPVCETLGTFPTFMTICRNATSTPHNLFPHLSLFFVLLTNLPKMRCVAFIPHTVEYSPNWDHAKFLNLF